jgi:DNA-binding protein YbaB
MQKEMTKKQGELESKIFTNKASLVTVTANGKKEILRN